MHFLREFLHVQLITLHVLCFTGLVALDYNKLTSISGNWFKPGNNAGGKYTFSFSNNNMTNVMNGGTMFSVNDLKGVITATFIFDQNNFRVFDPAWFTGTDSAHIKTSSTLILSFRENQITQIEPNTIDGFDSGFPDALTIDLSSNPFTQLNETALAPILRQLSIVSNGVILFYNTGNYYRNLPCAMGTNNCTFKGFYKYIIVIQYYIIIFLNI